MNAGGIAGLPPMPSEDPLWTAAAQRPEDRTASLAGWWPRVGAALVDGVIRVAIVALCAGLGAIAYGIDDAAGEIGIVVGLLIGLLLAFAVYAPVLLALWDGQTPGHRATDTRVVMADGSRMSGQRAFVREVLVKNLLIETIGGVILVVPIVNYLFPLWDKRNEALHDKICATRVVTA